MEVSHAVALPLWWSLGLIFPEEWAGRRQITSYFKLEWWLMLGLCYNTTPWRKPPSWERPTCHWMGGLGADRRLFFSRSVCSAWNWVYPAFNTSSPFWCKNIYICYLSLFSTFVYSSLFSLLPLFMAPLKCKTGFRNVKWYNGNGEKRDRSSYNHSASFYWYMANVNCVLTQAASVAMWECHSLKHKHTHIHTNNLSTEATKPIA